MTGAEVVRADMDFGEAMTWLVGPDCAVRGWLKHRWEGREGSGDWWPIAIQAGLCANPPETFNGIGLWPLQDGRLAAVASFIGSVEDHRTPRWAAALKSCIEGKVERSGPETCQCSPCEDAGFVACGKSSLRDTGFCAECQPVGEVEVPDGH